MSDAAENIPTLTDIAHAGDESMLNHFDAHQFNDAQVDSNENSYENDQIDNSEYDAQHLMEVSQIFENNISEPEEIPSIKLDNEQHNYIETEDFTDAMQLTSEGTAENDSETLLSETEQFDKAFLKEKINLAIKEILPGIEEQLKKQLYKELDL